MVRFAVIGTNWITDRFISAATKVEGFQLTAIYRERKNEQRNLQASIKFILYLLA
ncbi:hypothetical protein JCM9152_1396 [Halalkalibacter hemicellulosilyticusJCM 9152]|uniref:Oxidoreductase n=1 Tax=Halalkalibacter hemicellulosilyticusJCM 9152 TaxID=1236971 RepID=W4QD89_9BACI|nr:hypothetical protein JCM9152_1396 [Halalkalibacter hemicellulosilyticusJCM 9152]